MKGCDVVQTIENTLSKQYLREGYTNVHIVTEKGSNDRDGFVAQVVRVLITAEKDGKNIDTDLIVKCSRNDPEVRNFMPMTQLFLREIFMYKNVIPYYEQIQNELLKSDDQRCYFIKSVSACNKYLEEYIVLENMKPKGYMLSDKSDYEHAVRVYEMLGKLHALSYVFEKRHKAEFNHAATNIDALLYFNDLNEFDSSGTHVFMKKATRKFIDCIENEEHKNMLVKAVGSNSAEKLIQLTKTSKWKILSHGDFWLNNVFFKYQNNKPVRAVPVDFQSCRYESPMNDFLHFIGGSSDVVLRNHFWELFDVYYDSLKALIQACGYDVDEFYSYEDMKKELQDQTVFVFCISFIMFPFQMTYDGEDVQAHLMFSERYPNSFLEENEAYNKRVNDLVTDFVKWGLLK